jgi:TetR/AcrR family transcriptional regulator, tetracycline repressor protein
MTPNKPAPEPRATRFKTTSPPLTRDEIIAAALRYAHAGYLDRLTVRQLADELDVTPMALYRHIRDKDDLLEAVADALLAEAGLPDPDVPWTTCLTDLATSLRDVLRTHPPLVGLFTRQPMLSPMAITRLTAARNAITNAGYTPDDAHQFYAAVHTYTLGYSALEAARQAAARQHTSDPDQALITQFVTDGQFTFGLHALVRGLA